MDEEQCAGCSQIELLRRELTEKHAQNRTDIHRLRNDSQRISLEIAELRGKILPVVGDGQPGMLAQISTKLDGLAVQVTDLRIAQGADAGRRGEKEWLRATIVALVTGLVTGIVLIVVQRLWK